MNDYRDFLLNSIESFNGNAVILLRHVVKNKDSFSDSDSVFDMSKLLRHNMFLLF